jgi:hypothetical protein
MPRPPLLLLRGGRGEVGDIMKIRFNKDVELEVVESYDEELDKTETSDEFFSKGDEVDVDLLSSHPDTVGIQFGDGSCCYGLPKSCFEVLDMDDFEKLIFNGDECPVDADGCLINNDGDAETDKEDDGYPDYYNDMWQEED